MAASTTGGDLKEIRLNNPDVGQVYLYSKAGESHTINLAGFVTEDDSKNIDSSGTLLNLKTIKSGSYEATIVNAENNPNRMELQKLQGLSNSFNDTTFSATGINGVIYTGVGIVVGELSNDRSKATIAFKMNLSDIQIVG